MNVITSMLVTLTPLIAGEKHNNNSKKKDKNYAQFG
jgi:hypothetical protein